MLILLDIDGVMVAANPWRRPEFHSDGFPLFTSKSVNALNRILSETNAKVLLTTSHKSKYTLAQWKHIFSERGIKLKIVQRINKKTTLQDRKSEIIQWYSSHNQDGEDFIIIDDDKMLNGLPEYLKSHLVLTSPSVGLTEEQADEAIQNLRSQHAFSY